MDHLGWIFGKLPNGLWPRPRFGKLCCAFLQQTFRIGATPPNFPKIHRFPPQNYRKNRNEIFWIGNDPLRKFSENSSKMGHAIVPKFHWFSSSKYDQLNQLLTFSQKGISPCRVSNGVLSWLQKLVEDKWRQGWLSFDICEKKASHLDHRCFQLPALVVEQEDGATKEVREKARKCDTFNISDL